MIYFDNAATTEVCEKSVEAITDVLKNHNGNPSSLHFSGIDAENIIESCRQTIAERLGASKEELFFTSGGTEANNLAVLGAVNAAKRYRNKKKIVTTAIEHSSVFEMMKKLENEGYDIVYLKPDEHGNISAADIAEQIDENTILVSIMLINNEIGSVLPVNAVKNIIKIKNSPALLHCDCVQAFCKKNFSVRSLGADLVSISAHKIFGPKGVGALYIKKGVRIVPNAIGGEQEKKIRPGTQATSLIAGFAAAVTDYDSEKYYKKVTEINEYAKSRLKEFDNIVFNSDDNASPYILNFSILGIRSETLLNFMSERKICVSSGSACAKGNASHVLTALTKDKRISDSAIRLSFSHLNTKAEADEFITALHQADESLAKVKI